MLQFFLKSFGISFVFLWSVFFTLVIALSHPWSEGGSFFALFFGFFFFGSIFLVVNTVISLIIASIYSIMSRGKVMQPGNESRPHLIRIALYDIVILLALFVVFLKYMGQ